MTDPTYDPDLLRDMAQAAEWSAEDHERDERGPLWLIDLTNIFRGQLSFGDRVQFVRDVLASDWLRQHDAEVAAKALEDAADIFTRPIAKLLHQRAREIRHEAGDAT